MFPFALPAGRTGDLERVPLKAVPRNASIASIAFELRSTPRARLSPRSLSRGFFCTSSLGGKRFKDDPSREAPERAPKPSRRVFRHDSTIAATSAGFITSRMEVREAARRTLSGSSLRRSLVVALVVGTALNLINQGPEMLSGEWPVIWKLALTYVVPFLVASYGTYAAFRSPS